MASLRFEQVADGNVERSGEPEQVERRTVTDAALDAAHVAAADASVVGEALLRHTALLTQFTDTGSEPLEGGMASRLAGLAGHVADAARSTPFGPRPIGYNVGVGFATILGMDAKLTDALTALCSELTMLLRRANGDEATSAAISRGE